jgi:hypothetical protein
MSNQTVYILIPNIAYSESFGPSFLSPQVPGVAYYNTKQTTSTVIWSVGNITPKGTSDLFRGIITIQATLKEEPTFFDWFNVMTLPISDDESTQSGYSVITGNYTLMRASVTDWVSGPIRQVSICY